MAGLRARLTELSYWVSIHPEGTRHGQTGSQIHADSCRYPRHVGRAGGAEDLRPAPGCGGGRPADIQCRCRVGGGHGRGCLSGRGSRRPGRLGILSESDSHQRAANLIRGDDSGSPGPHGWLDWFVLGSNRVDFTVEVPRTYPVDLRTSGGSLDVRNLNAWVRGKTSGGSIHVQDVVGTVDVHTSGGGVSAERVKRLRQFEHFGRRHRRHRFDRRSRLSTLRAVVSASSTTTARSMPILPGAASERNCAPTMASTSTPPAAASR